VKWTVPVYPVAVLANWSSAVTVKLKAVPAVCGVGAVTTNVVAAAGFTVMELDVPVMDEVTVSVAVMARVPGVLSVTENVPVPFVNVEFAGNVADASVLVKCTVPTYPVEVLLNWSRAVTVMLKAVPAVWGDDAVTTNLVAAAAFTVTVPDVPEMDGVVVSVEVMVWFPAVFSVAENVPTPLVNVESAGNVAAPSLVVKCTVPAYAGVVLLLRSTAVTVKVKAVPAVAVDGAETTNFVVGPGSAVIALLVPVSEEFTESVAVTVNTPDFLGDTLKFNVPFVSVRGLPLEYKRLGSAVLVRFTVPL
jgi:hypothetical protein